TAALLTRGIEGWLLEARGLRAESQGLRLKVDELFAGLRQGEEERISILAEFESYRREKEAEHLAATRSAATELAGANERLDASQLEFHAYRNEKEQWIASLNTQLEKRDLLLSRQIADLHAIEEEVEASRHKFDAYRDEKERRIASIESELKEKESALSRQVAETKTIEQRSLEQLRGVEHEAELAAQRHAEEMF